MVLEAYLHSTLPGSILEVVSHTKYNGDHSNQTERHRYHYDGELSLLINWK